MALSNSSRFSRTPPTLDIQRSTFDRHSNCKTTFNAGKLIPFYVDEVLPGDTFDMSVSSVVRMSTPIFPVMDNAYLDYFWFFVPARLTWDHWKEFNGENDSTRWTSTFDKPVPFIEVPAESDLKSTVADYFGLPLTSGLGGNTYSVNVLPFRAYQLVFNRWFRDQNLQDPVFVNHGDNGDVWSTINTILPVNKYHDYFTSCLPAPQKGPSITLPADVGSINPASLLFPVNTSSSTTVSSSSVGVKFGSTTANSILGVRSVALRGTELNAYSGTQEGAQLTGGIYPNNLYADGTSLANAGIGGSFTINELRQAFAVQRLFEKDARGGSRYAEVLRAHFGVTSPDASLQDPEFLFQGSVPVNMTQVVQSSATDTTSPQGNTAAFSKTVNGEHCFTKSFTEHGYLLGLCCVRTKHTYQYGLNRMWSRKTRTDFYWPSLANLGEQAVLNKEIYVAGTSEDDEVFGYQEAWAEYRYKPDIVTSAFRHNYAGGSLDAWHYADVYSSCPKLSDSWIRETDVNVQRTLAVDSKLADQFLADFNFFCKVTRPLPLYSVPGLADHF